MNILSEIKNRFRDALSSLSQQPDDLLEMIRSTSDPKFGDYQANFAMPLGKKIGKNPREIAADLMSRVDLSDMCEPPEIAGPGFINLRLRKDWLLQRVVAAIEDVDQLAIKRTDSPRTYVIDYSAPNVAKPMHVGHIRSTVIGDSLYRVLAFLGHRVISDNHIGDWGTQFGMIIYGFKHFLDSEKFEASEVDELARLYRFVSQLVDYHKSIPKLPELVARLEEQQAELETARSAPSSGDKAKDKKQAKAIRRLESSAQETEGQIAALRAKLDAVQNDEPLAKIAEEHAKIAEEVLRETAKLHAGDAENRGLWQQFLPACLADIEKIYARLNVQFDHTHGESYYHDRLAGVVEQLVKQGLASESDGAMCVFLEEFDHPFLVQKRDGAYLYGTTDLATIQYRMETFRPDTILYIVDFRQGLHFKQLFATARLWGYPDVQLAHVEFGTVMGQDNRPFKTRSGDTVGLGGLLDEAERRALQIVSENDDRKEQPDLTGQERRNVARTVGIAAIKYADLTHNRSSDYVFSYDKMLATEGNTATYMQYAYARVRSIFRRGEIDITSLRSTAGDRLRIDHPSERALALALLGLAEALESTVADFRPNHLTAYLFELANRYSTFYHECPVLKAETPEIRDSRLLLCDLTARTLKKGLELLGIDVVEKM